MDDLTPPALRQTWRDRGFYDEFDLYGAFRATATARPDHPAVVDADRTLTYRELLAAVDRIAVLLDREGVLPGDVVAVQLPNSWVSCAVDFAIAAVGAICMPFPAHYREREVTQLLGRAAASAYIGPRSYHGSDHIAMVETLRAELPSLRTLVVADREQDAHPALLAALRESTPWAARRVDPSAGCRVFVTSGTESAPKMVLYSHEAVGRPFEVMQSEMGIDATARMYPGVPLGSGMGVQVCALLARHGATVVLTPAFKADAALDVLERHRVTHFYGVPTMVQMMLAQPSFADRDLTALRVVVSAGSSLPAHLARKLREDLGLGTISFYGCSDGVSINTGLDLPIDIAAVTVGRSDERVSTVKIVTSDGADVPRGEPGEIWGIGPFAPLRYLNSPELDARYRTADGWVRTGDLGVMREDGNVAIVGRVKDIIIRGGFNISPTEIDDLLAAHPDIAQASCIGVPDERLGEVVCAAVVLREGAEPPTVASLGEFLLAEGLSKYKLPERIVVRAELPTSPVGKILKRVLRDEVAAKLATPAPSVPTL
ncbi:class I adenylate-forming enzyme family protein [Pseudonocardia xishanensis]|uniref:class I adenylate-forming enzyme family protein n=1 Tax=Pseudonocardia xishanensis TaxID=630995 RepID=UPI0031EDC2A7